MNRVHVPNASYTPGRARPVRLIVLHTTESPSNTGRAVSVAQFLTRPDVRASAHYIVDAGTIVDQIAEADTAWAAPGANADGIQVEQCAYAGWAAEWFEPPAQLMLHNTAQLLAEISTRTGIPLVRLSNAELAAGRSGVIGHVQASDVYKASDHWDPGPSYLYDDVLRWARELQGGSGSPGPATPTSPAQSEEDDDMLRYIVSSTDGTGYAVDGIKAYPMSSDYTRTVLQATGVLMTRAQMAAKGWTVDVDGASIRAAFEVQPVTESVPDKQ